MSSLGHMSPSLLGKIKAGLRPRPPKPKPKVSDSQPKEAQAKQPSQADAARAKAAEQEEDEERVAGAYWLRQNLPAWLVSMVTHVILFLALALMSFSNFEEPKTEGTILSTAPSEDMVVEDILDEFELDPTEDSLDENVMPSEITDISAVEMSEFGEVGETPDLEPLDASLPGPLFSDDLEWEEIGTSLGEGETGFGTDGLGPPTEFFGVKSQGRRFMFVVDNSNSMNKGRFETAVAELTKSINKLSPNQEFYIVFYSDMAYPLFYPESAKSWVRATDSNKAKVRRWLAGVHRCLQTNGREAFKLAFGMEPDVMYVLGDGAFTDNPIPEVLATKNDKIVIHTLGFGLVRNGRRDFETIAAKFKGKFHEVQVTPAMVALSNQLNRPRNNKPNGVWGLKLGGGKKKPAKPKKKP